MTQLRLTKDISNRGAITIGRCVNNSTVAGTKKYFLTGVAPRSLSQYQEVIDKALSLSEVYICVEYFDEDTKKQEKVIYKKGQFFKQLDTLSNLLGDGRLSIEGKIENQSLNWQMSITLNPQ